MLVMGLSSISCARKKVVQGEQPERMGNLRDLQMGATPLESLGNAKDLQAEQAERVKEANQKLDAIVDNP